MLSHNDILISQFAVSRKLLSKEQFQTLLRTPQAREALNQGVSLLVLLFHVQYLSKEAFEKILSKHVLMECQSCLARSAILGSAIPPHFSCNRCSGTLKLAGSAPLSNLELLRRFIQQQEQIARQIFKGDSENPQAFLSDYRILKKVGEGGMGAVYLAEHLRLHNKVALKILHSHRLNAQTIQRFLIEARTIAQLDHPHIVRVYDVGEERGRYFMAMQFIEGQSFQEKMIHSGAFSLPETIPLLKQIASALHYAHQAGIIHRDIKPDNLLIDTQGNAKITDFGIIRRVNQDFSISSTGQIIGTPHFMAPEQCLGEELSPKTDIYALGATWYYLLSAQLPFQGESLPELAKQHLEEQPRPLQELKPHLPRNICSLIQQMLAKSPKERLPSMHYLHQELERLTPSSAQLKPPLILTPEESAELLAYSSKPPLVLTPEESASLSVFSSEEDLVEESEQAKTFLELRKDLTPSSSLKNVSPPKNPPLLLTPEKEEVLSSSPRISGSRPLENVEQDVFKLEGASEFPKIQGYTIQKAIGSGGMGTVYLAYQESMERQVALKILPLELSSTPEFVARFQREALATAKLNHPNIARAFDFGEFQGLQYLVMEYIRGKNVEELLASGPLPEKKALAIGRYTARALAEASQYHLVHRDIKPGNIMINDEGVVKLLDFGLAKQVNQKSNLTQKGLAVGTPYYTSPEQASGEEVDFRSDQYSLGATLFHLLTGQVPFEGKSPVAVMTKQVYEPLPSPQSVNPRLSDACSHLLLKMMEKKASMRYQSPQELLDAIDKARRGELPAYTVEKPPSPQNLHKKSSEFQPRLSKRAGRRSLLRKEKGLIFWGGVALLLFILTILVLMIKTLSH